MHNEVRLNYLASPPLVVAYALAGTMDFDPTTEPIASTPDGGMSRSQICGRATPRSSTAVRASVTSAMYTDRYASVFSGDERWAGIDTSTGGTFGWEPDSTYVLRPPYFDSMGKEPEPVSDVRGSEGARDPGRQRHDGPHIAGGSIAPTTPAAISPGARGRAIRLQLVRRQARQSRGDDWGTFANLRLRNLLAPGTEGGVTIHLPDGEQMSIFDASERYATEGVPLVVLAGREYGSGSSRDWAAKGPSLLGVPRRSQRASSGSTVRT